MFSPISSSPQRCQPFHRAMPWTSSKAIARHGCIGLDHFLLRDSMGHQRHAAQALYQHCTMTLAASCTCFFLAAWWSQWSCLKCFYFQLADSGLFPKFQHLQKLREWVSTSLLCFFACRQYKGFNSRAMRFEAEFLMCGNSNLKTCAKKSDFFGGGKSGRRSWTWKANAVSVAVIKTGCLYRSSLPGMLLSCETTPYSYLLYIYTLSININIYSTLLYSTLLLHSTLFYSILLYLTDLSLTQSLVSFIILYHFENLQSCTATFKCPVMVSERPSIRTWLECWKNSFPPLLRLLRFFVAGIHGTAQLGCSRHQWLRLQGQTFWNEASRSEMDEKIWTIEQIMKMPESFGKWKWKLAETGPCQVCYHQDLVVQDQVGA